MATVQEIEKAVEHLPEKELKAFRVWFQSFIADLWDKPFEEDARNRKLDELANQALNDLEQRE